MAEQNEPRMSDIADLGGDRSLVARMELVPVEPGCAVLWDWRTPHQTAAEHPGPDTREVVYTSFLPDIPINR